MFDPHPKSYKKKGSVNIFVTGDDRKEPLRYKEPLLHTVVKMSTKDTSFHSFFAFFSLLEKTETLDKKDCKEFVVT